MNLRAPVSLQGQVPQVLYDWLTDLYNDNLRLDAENRALSRRLATLNSSPLANLTPASLTVALGLGGTTVIEGTHSERTTGVYPATNYAVGTQFFETDRKVFYLVYLVAGIRTWIYSSGNQITTLASRPSDLGTNDTGYRFVDSTTDNETHYIWTGTEWVTIGGYLQQIEDAATVTITTLQLLKHMTSGAAGVGFGGGEVTQLENAAGTAVTALYRTAEWLDATNASEDSKHTIWLQVAGTLTKIISLSSPGNLLLEVAAGLIQLGGTSNSFPAIKRNAANLQARLADDSATTDLEVADEVYGAGWNGSVEVPTKNAVYDEIETVIALIASSVAAVISDAAYGAGWNGVTTIAPSKNAVYDEMQTKLAANGVNFGPAAVASITVVNGQVTAIA